MPHRNSFQTCYRATTLLIAILAIESNSPLLAQQSESIDQRKSLTASSDMRALFNGTDLTGWQKIDDDYFEHSGEVRVIDGELEIAAGKPGSGVIVAGENAEHLLRTNYRIELEAMRVQGRDFFCGMTFPVGENYLTLILGGWGGTTVGLSNLDGVSAIENETSSFFDFENKHWYKIRHEVTADRVRTWLDGDKLIDVDISDKRLEIWWQQEPVRPLGLSTWHTTARYRNIQVTPIKQAEDEESND